MRNIVIIGIGGDIGYNLAKFYIQDGHKVIGTYRTRNSNVEDIESDGDKIFSYQLDITDRTKVGEFSERMMVCGWDTLILSVGDINPVGKFFRVPFSKWEDSVDVNLVSQLGVLHSLYKYREPGASVAFFAGMGTNGPVDDQSAICLSKIALIKMVELLDYECDDINPFIIGTGFVRTKIHEATLVDGDKNSASYKKLKAWMDNGIAGTSMEDIYKNIEWCVEMGKGVCGGRNFSTVHDCWGEEGLVRMLKTYPDVYKLRRYGNNWMGERKET